MRHALILGTLGFVVSVAGVFATLTLHISVRPNTRSRLQSMPCLGGLLYRGAKPGE